MKVSIIIPIFNKKEYTQKCLESVFLFGSKYDFEIIVVDNGSTDDSANYLRGLKDKINIISNKNNLGFAKACNQGAKIAKGKYLLFLNNDTIVTNKWLDILVKEIEKNKNIAMVGPKLLYPNGAVQHAGVVFGEDKLPYHVFREEDRNKYYVNKKRSLQAITGACILIKDDIFVQVNGFDEIYINSFEDIDLCLKIKRLGYDVVYCPKSVIFHHESISEGRKNYEERNSKIFLSKWKDFILVDYKNFEVKNDFIEKIKYCFLRFLHLIKMFFIVFKKDGYKKVIEIIIYKLSKFNFFPKYLSIFEYFAKRKKKDFFHKLNGRRLFIDCTFVYNHPEVNTGIQRVVKNIIRNIDFYSEKKNIQIVPIILSENHIFAVSKKDALNNNIKNIIKISFLKYRKYKNLIVVEKGDIFLLPDSIWDYDIWSNIKLIKEKNGIVIGVIHDLIPILYPQFFVQNLKKNFYDFFYKSLKYFDGYIAVSKTSMQDLITYLQNQKININKYFFDSFTLGADLKNKNYEAQNISSEIKKVFDNDSVYLMVSTIEPRKNHVFVLDAFDELWKNNKDIKLCFVGKIGWDVDLLIDRIKNHREFGKRLFMFNHANDDELVFCYQKSKMLIFASFTEGFGLPIVESLFFNLPVLASDTPIHREVGGDKIDYFDLTGKNMLIKKVLENENLKLSKNLNKNIAIHSWKESAEELFEKTLKMAEEVLKK